MAKKQTKKIAISDILKGKFLVEEGASKNWSFLVFLTCLAVFMISSTHWLQNKIVKGVELEKEVKELKSEYTDAEKELMTYQTESEVVKIALQDSLKVSDTQPFRLVVPKKIATTQEENKK